jgi:hypothetical protein
VILPWGENKKFRLSKFIFNKIYKLGAQHLQKYRDWEDVDTAKPSHRSYKN